jgi:hypothetical protein
MERAATMLPRSENFLHIRQVRIEKTPIFFLDKEAGIAMMHRDTRERIKAVLSVFAGFVLLAISCCISADGKASGAGSFIAHSVSLSMQIDCPAVIPEHPARALAETCFFRTLDP